MLIRNFMFVLVFDIDKAATTMKECRTRENPTFVRHSMRGMINQLAELKKKKKK